MPLSSALKLKNIIINQLWAISDGKAWLCKVVFKKKTGFWLSVWDGFFKAGFYFVERHCPGIHELEIDDSIINSHCSRQ